MDKLHELRIKEAQSKRVRRILREEYETLASGVKEHNESLGQLWYVTQYLKNLSNMSKYSKFHRDNYGEI